MLALALRGLAARKLRGVLTAFAILLGVAMVAGTFMLKGSLDTAFDDIFAEASEGVDVIVKPKLAFESGFDLPESDISVPASLVGEVEKVDGVEQAVGDISDGTSIAILDENGDKIGPPSGGPPQIANSVLPEPFDPFTYTEGGEPTGDDEVAMDSITSEEEGYELGDTIRISGREGAKDYTLSGIGRFGTGVPLGGASLAVFTVPEAQRITGKDGFTVIDVEAAEGVSAEELRDRVNAALPAEYEAATGAEEAAQESTDIKDGFSFLTIALLVFAGISVFVGAFLIFNTFSITVAQRTREFGMLRTLGASSRQVLASVVLEALLLGIIASVLGIGLGFGFVQLVTTAFKAIGFELPQSGVVVPPAAIIAPMIVGIVATLGSAIVPALRATRVTPLEALRETSTIDAATTKRRTWIARGLLVLAVAAIAGGLFATSSFGSALPLLGLGLVLLFVGIAMLAATLVKPLASFVGRPIEWLRGVTGRLARENTLRNPARTATTSAALMIGVALVVFAAIFASSATKSVGDALDQTYVGDLTITSTDGFSPFSPEIGEAVAEIDGVETVSAVAGSGARIELPSGPDEQIITGLDGNLPAVAALDWVDGSDATLEGLAEDEAIAEAQWAEDNDVSVGDDLTLTTQTGETVSVTIAGTVRDEVQLLVPSLALPIETLRTRFQADQDFVDLVGFASGADFEATNDAVDALVEERFPQAQAQNQEELKDQQKQSVNQLLAFIYVLLALSVIISLFGVVNTLVLTIYERTREIGMLRAIGASRSQIRRMVRYESLITAMIGAIIGAAVGLAVGVAAVEALKDEGLVLGIPVIGIVVVLVVAAIAGILAGVWPARRAAKIEVMEALQYE